MRRLLVAAGLMLLGLLVLGGIYVTLGLQRLPDLSRFDLPVRGASPLAPPRVRATFLGVSTLLFDDGKTQILIDGFFTRPSIKQVFGGKIASDPDLVRTALARADVSRLAAVVVTHSHYDHAMDSALVASLTGADVVGSTSTANIARGGDVPESRIRTPAVGETMAFGAFKLTLLPSGHIPSGYPQGEIEAPLRQPARANAYKLGTAYAVLIEHEGRRLLINASAGYASEAIVGVNVDAVYLGVGQLGKHATAYADAYWRNIIEATQARHVAVIHWDDFTRPLSLPLQPIPTLLDDLATTLSFLVSKATPRQVRITMPQAWQTFDAFAP